MGLENIKTRQLYEAENPNHIKEWYDLYYKNYINGLQVKDGSANWNGLKGYYANSNKTGAIQYYDPSTNSFYTGKIDPTTGLYLKLNGQHVAGYRYINGKYYYGKDLLNNINNSSSPIQIGLHLFRFNANTGQFYDLNGIQQNINGWSWTVGQLNKKGYTYSNGRWSYKAPDITTETKTDIPVVNKSKEKVKSVIPKGTTPKQTADVTPPALESVATPAQNNPLSNEDLKSLITSTIQSVLHSNQQPNTNILVANTQKPQQPQVNPALGWSHADRVGVRNGINDAIRNGTLLSDDLMAMTQWALQNGLVGSNLLLKRSAMKRYQLYQQNLYATWKKNQENKNITNFWSNLNNQNRTDNLVDQSNSANIPVYNRDAQTLTYNDPNNKGYDIEFSNFNLSNNKDIANDQLTGTENLSKLSNLNDFGKKGSYTDLMSDYLGIDGTSSDDARDQSQLLYLNAYNSGKNKVNELNKLNYNDIWKAK